MNDIPISEALLLWNSGLNGDTPAFAVRPLGHDDYYEYQCQLGACLRVWHEMSTDQRKMRLLIDIWHITAFYAVPASMMVDELMQIPEYRDMLADDCLPAAYRHERQ